MFSAAFTIAIVKVVSVAVKPIQIGKLLANQGKLVVE